MRKNSLTKHNFISFLSRKMREPIINITLDESDVDAIITTLKDKSIPLGKGEGIVRE